MWARGPLPPRALSGGQRRAGSARSRRARPNVCARGGRGSGAPTPPQSHLLLLRRTRITIPFVWPTRSHAAAIDMNGMRGALPSAHAHRVPHSLERTHR